MGRTHDYGVVSHSTFEGLVRRAWRRGARPEVGVDAVPLALDIAKIVTTLDRQPDLIEGKRLNHNLGELKMKWLRDLRDQYTKLPTKEKP